MTDPNRFRAFTSTLPVEFPGMMGHLEYTGWADEQMSWKTTCYVGDWTFVPQIRVKGADALKLFSDLSINSLDDFPLDRAKHCVMCNEDGKVIVEGILLRHADDDFEFEAHPGWVYYNIEKHGYDVEYTFGLDHKLQVSGPNALALLEKLTDTTLRDVKFMHTKLTGIGNAQVKLLRQGMAGEIGFELHGPIQQHDDLIDAVMEAGREFGIRRLGRRTFHANHVEASYPTTGMEYWNAVSDERRRDYVDFMTANTPEAWNGTPLADIWLTSLSTAVMGSWDGDSIEELYRSPIELGWGKSIRFDHDFIGREALQNELEHPGHAIVTLEFDAEDVMAIYASLFTDGEAFTQIEIPHPPYIAAWTDWVIKDGARVGHSTFPLYSYFFRKVISLGFVPPELSAPGTEVGILWGHVGSRQIEIRATVRPAPYKKDNRRIDLSKLS